MTATVEVVERVVRFRTPRGRAADMTIREGTNDWNTLQACMTEDEYGLRDWRGTGWAFDIGGYLGGVGIGLALDNPQLRVLIVEPVPDNARLIRENVARNDVGDRVTVIENAVGGRNREPVKVWFNYSGSESLLHHANVGNSSIAYDHGGEAAHDEIIYSDPESIGTLVDAAEWPDTIDLIKIDCEGGEWAIFGDRHELDGRGVKLIVGEAHAVRGHRGSDIVGLLPGFDVALSGDTNGTCEFRAVLR